MHKSNPTAGYFVSGISTEVGKTVVAALLTEALQADYWKPVQAGDLHHSDTDKVRALVSNPRSVFHPEGFRLNSPMSPHAAAARDQIEIRLQDFTLPATSNTLIVEGAGGLLVPLNDRDCIIDLIQALGLPLIMVSAHYLGSINHTLLSIEAVKSRGIPIAGIIFNGGANPETESIIAIQSGVKILGRIDRLNPLDAAAIQQLAQEWKI